MYYIIFYIESDRYYQRFDSYNALIKYADCLRRDITDVHIITGKGA